MQHDRRQQRPGSSAFGFLIVTITIDMIAGGMIIPIFPSLVQSLVGGDPVVGARMLGYFITAWAAMQVIFSPILGSPSDHFGRRPLLLISLGGLAVSSAMLALAPNVAWLLVARLVSGAAASTMAVGNAYIPVRQPPGRRPGHGAAGGRAAAGSARRPRDRATARGRGVTSRIVRTT